MVVVKVCVLHKCLCVLYTGLFCGLDVKGVLSLAPLEKVNFGHFLGSYEKFENSVGFLGLKFVSLTVVS